MAHGYALHVGNHFADDFVDTKEPVRQSDYADVTGAKGYVPSLRITSCNGVGDPEREAEAIRSKEGIPLIKPVVDDLLDISRKTGIPFDVEQLTSC